MVLAEPQAPPPSQVSGRRRRVRGQTEAQDGSAQGTRKAQAGHRTGPTGSQQLCRA